MGHMAGCGWWWPGSGFMWWWGCWCAATAAATAAGWRWAAGGPGGRGSGPPPPPPTKGPAPAAAATTDPAPALFVLLFRLRTGIGDPPPAADDFQQGPTLTPPTRNGDSRASNQALRMGTSPSKTPIHSVGGGSWLYCLHHLTPCREACGPNSMSHSKLMTLVTIFFISLFFSTWNTRCGTSSNRQAGKSTHQHHTNTREGGQTIGRTDGQTDRPAGRLAGWLARQRSFHCTRHGCHTFTSTSTKLHSISIWDTRH